MTDMRLQRRSTSRRLSYSSSPCGMMEQLECRTHLDASIQATHVYYKGSAFAAAGVTAAYDSSKQLLPSGAAATSLGFTNLLNTSFGINGVVIDVADMPGSSLSASDFVFRVSPTGLFNSSANPPSNWSNAPAPTGIFVTPASGASPAQVRIEWADNAIANRWLQIQMLNSPGTGLPTTKVFYLGHLQGELNGDASVASAYFLTNADLAQINPVGTLATIDNPRDVDKNRFVLNADGVIVRNAVNAGLSLRQITIPVAGAAGEGRVNYSPPSIMRAFSAIRFSDSTPTRDNLFSDLPLSVLDTAVVALEPE